MYNNKELRRSASYNNGETIGRVLALGRQQEKGGRKWPQLPSQTEAIQRIDTEVWQTEQSEWIANPMDNTQC